MAKRKTKKGKAGRPMGTGKYGKLVRFYMAEDMHTRITTWGFENGATSFADAMRIILAEKMGIKP